MAKKNPPTPRIRETTQTWNSEGSLSITSKRIREAFMTGSNITTAFSGGARSASGLEEQS
jgi:hypothetical protein